MSSGQQSFFWNGFPWKGNSFSTAFTATTPGFGKLTIGIAIGHALKGFPPKRLYEL
jgi:hypothetical protein